MAARVVEGVVQHYEWGDQRFIPDLLGVAGEDKPWAELWLGTHVNGPAHFGDGTALQDLTGPLPYLLKVLSAAQPLSLQAHPTTEQAIDGYARGVFADANAKPELLCALTPFEALCGFRPYGSTVDYLRRLGGRYVRRLRRNCERGLARRFVSGPFRGQGDDRVARDERRSSCTVGLPARPAIRARRSERGRHAAAQLRGAAARRSAPLDRWEPARVPARFGDRAHGRERQCRAPAG